MVSARARVAELEAELTTDVQEAAQHHQAAVVRVQRIHEHVHRRLAVYRRSLVRAHPEGAWANSCSAPKRRKSPAGPCPTPTCPTTAALPPDLLPTTEDDPEPDPDEDEPERKIIVLRSE